MINNRTIEPSVDAGGIYIQTDSHTNIELVKTDYYSISTRETPCRSDHTVLSTDSIHYNLTTQISNYNHETCNKLYVQLNYINKNCGCIDSSLIDYFDLVNLLKNQNQNQYHNMCVTNAEFRCIKNQLEETSLLTAPYENCPFECYRNWFETTVSSSTYPSKPFSDLLSTESAIEKFTNSSKVDFGSHFSSLSVYYKLPWFVKIETTFLLNFNTLIGLIGRKILILLFSKKIFLIYFNKQKKVVCLDYALE